jgi:hypothetical protein
MQSALKPTKYIECLANQLQSALKQHYVNNGQLTPMIEGAIKFGGNGSWMVTRKLQVTVGNYVKNLIL